MATQSGWADDHCRLLIKSSALYARIGSAAQECVESNQMQCVGFHVADTRCMIVLLGAVVDRERLSDTDATMTWEHCRCTSAVKDGETPVSYTHLTLPTICSV